jgi:hypothetical protein
LKIKNANKNSKNFRLSAVKKSNEIEISIWQAFYQFYCEKITNLPSTNPSHSEILHTLTLLEQNFNSFVESKQFISWNSQVSLNLSINENWLLITNIQFTQLYDVFIQWLRELETLNLKEKNYETHHIIPKFASGTNDSINLIDCAPLNHSLAHALRFLFSSNRGDLFGAVSASVSSEERAKRFQAENVQNAYDRTTRNPEWQKTHGAKGLANRKKPEMRPRQRALVAAAAKKTQPINSRYRVNPITWFMASQTLIWANNTQINQKFETSGSNDFFENSAAGVARKLLSYIPNASLEKSPYLISGVLTGENSSRYGWSLTSVFFQSGNYAPALIREATTFALKNQFTLANLTELRHNFNSLEIDVCEKILIFTEFYKKFLADKA